MKRLLRAIVILAVLVAGSAGAAVWYFHGRDPSVSYRTVKARRADLVSTISATGTVVPEDVVDVGAQVNGKIASFGEDKSGHAVDYRSTVDEGSVLARIDDALYGADVATAQAQLEQNRAQVRVAEATLDQAKARLDQTTRDWERAQRLGSSRALAQADYDAAKSNYEQAKANVAVSDASIGQAKGAVSMAEAALKRAKQNFDYCTIPSPVNGVIIDRRVEIGQTVVASLNAPSLFLIAKDLRRMQVLVQVNEADIGNVRPGQPVVFTVEAFPGQLFHGEVRKIRLNATMAQNVVTYTVEIVTDNSDLKLLPYLTANVTFEVARREHALTVPNAALRWAPRDDAAPDAPEPAASQSARTGSLWVLDAGRPRPVRVRLGITDSSLTEIEGDDLTESSDVIVGEAAARARGAAPASPFTPQMFRGRGR